MYLLLPVLALLVLVTDTIVLCTSTGSGMEVPYDWYQYGTGILDLNSKLRGLARRLYFQTNTTNQNSKIKCQVIVIVECSIIIYIKFLSYRFVRMLVPTKVS